MTFRCASGPRQQSELLRGDRRRHGCGHRILGQFPSHLELNKHLPCCTQSLPAYFLLHPHATCPNSSAGLDRRGAHCVCPNPLNSPPALLSAGDPPSCEKVQLFLTFQVTFFLFFFTQLLHRNKYRNLSIELAKQKFKKKRLVVKTEGKKK